MRLRVKSSFAGKMLGAAGLVALADWLFWEQGGVGSTLGIFAIAWTAVTVMLSPALRHRGGALAAAGGATILALTLLYDPAFLAFCLFWALLVCAALLPRHQGFDHAGRWVPRLIVHGVSSVVGPWADLFRIGRRVRRGGIKTRGLLRLLPLPLIGGAMFLALFAAANPLISDALSRIALPGFSPESAGRALFWGVVLVAVWATLRPRRIRLPFTAGYHGPAVELPGVSVGSVTLALLTFNALFALQNGLDLAFLWSGAALPNGMTLADYAHRSAYPLILTALLAGLFVLVVLRPGSATATVPLIRRLVVLWIVQNVFLVASSILRTLDYIEVYSLTQLRIAALIWMALVAIGLVLIVWRMLAGRSGAWLINANALAAGLALTACFVVDLGSVAAAWNVRHAREVGGKGAALDLCYLRELGRSSVVSLAELERRGDLDPAFAERVAWVRHDLLLRMIERQRGGGWIWRDDRRLRRIATMLSGQRLAAPPVAGPTGRGCDGGTRPPPPALDQGAATAPALTNEARQ